MPASGGLQTEHILKGFLWQVEAVFEVHTYMPQLGGGSVRIQHAFFYERHLQCAKHTLGSKAILLWWLSLLLKPVLTCTLCSHGSSPCLRYVLFYPWTTCSVRLDKELINFPKHRVIFEFGTRKRILSGRSWEERESPLVSVVLSGVQRATWG